ncbi:MAG: protein-glutamate O-methyltransferase CheR [Candidatus Delongbacteria bacterium]|nr:protein-glutamate O-methyltransferase CheR [Candidatus Delongbacteria bacterium]MBN2834413.1 protein-glutamate O-methyltransferase CheR [Candidatus Delongbacteria bacterium]
MKLDFTENEFKKIRDFIYETSGMYFPDNKKYLIDDRISKRLESLRLDSVDSYIHYLKFDRNKATELNNLFDAVTINETSFYRNIPQIEALQKIILPELIETKIKSGIKSIKLWSAACSSGEEPYTMSMVLKEILGSSFNSWNIEILATDISIAILEQAKRGVYNSNALRNTPPEIVSKYFISQGRDFVLNNEIKSKVKFINLNLMDRMKMRMIRSVDVIFCRNVLIYFDVQSKKQVISSLYSSLSEDGYLFIGHSESMHGISSAFKLVHMKNTMVYKKQR